MTPEAQREVFDAMKEIETQIRQALEPLVKAQAERVEQMILRFAQDRHVHPEKVQLNFFPVIHMNPSLSVISKP